MLCAVSVRLKAKDQSRCVSTQDTQTQTDTHTYNVCPWKGEEGKTLTCMLHKQTKARGGAGGRWLVSASHTQPKIIVMMSGCEHAGEVKRAREHTIKALCNIERRVVSPCDMQF